MELDQQTIKEMMTSSPAGTQIVKDNSGFITEMTNLEPQIAMLEHDLRSEYYVSNSDGTGEWKSLGKPIMNDEGIKKLISRIRMVSNRIVFTSNFSDTEINFEMRGLLKELRKNIASEYKQWNLSKCNFELIVKCFEGTVFSSWKTAKGEGFRTSAFGTVNERRIVGSQDKHKSLFGGLGIFGGNE